MMSSDFKVALFPWDPKSEDHIKQLYEQRVKCNWDYEKVGSEWKGEQLKGNKCMYWIVCPRYILFKMLVC